MPYDKFAYDILTASGSNVENPAASYLQDRCAPPDAAMENTTHLFLAIRFNCNKCHDHPFERWTQDQYYNLASYFAQVGRTRRPEVQGPEDRRHRRRRRAVAARRDRRTTPRPARSRTSAPAPRPSRRSRSTTATTIPPADPRRDATREVDHVEGQPVLRQELREPRLELPARRRHHRADRRHPRGQSRRPTRPCSTDSPKEFVASEVRRPQADGDDLQVAARISCRSRRTSGTRTTT